jgi:hypothetical protein
LEEVQPATQVAVRQEVLVQDVVKVELVKLELNLYNQEIQVHSDLVTLVLDVQVVLLCLTEAVEVLERLLHILVPVELMVNLVELENQ